ncbi:MAG: helix-turn-helix domain-containing protein [Bacillota bacterium]
MTSFFDSILKELPPEIPHIINITDYSSSKISIIKTEYTFSQPTTFNIYKFLLPLTSDFPIVIVDNKKFSLKKNKLFPINPGQYHYSDIGQEPMVHISPFLAIFIDKKFVRETGKTLFNQENIIFENYNYNLNSNLKHLINLFIEETTHQQTGYQFILENLNIQILINLIRTIESNCLPTTTIMSKSDKKTINFAIDYLQKNYDQDFSLSEIAEEISYSPYHFIRIFKKETGKTPFEYLLDLKIEKAKKMLKNSNKYITDICFECGFNNRSHFSVVFKRKTGHSPTEYRKLYQNQ